MPTSSRARNSGCMSVTTPPVNPSTLGVAQGARVAAQDSARRAGVDVLELRTPAEAERGAELLREVWRGGESPVPANLLRTVQYTGGYKSRRGEAEFVRNSRMRN